MCDLVQCEYLGVGVHVRARNLLATHFYCNRLLILHLLLLPVNLQPFTFDRIKTIYCMSAVYCILFPNFSH